MTGKDYSTAAYRKAMDIAKDRVKGTASDDIDPEVMAREIASEVEGRVPTKYLAEFIVGIDRLRGPSAVSQPPLDDIELKGRLSSISMRGFGDEGVVTPICPNCGEEYRVMDDVSGRVFCGCEDAPEWVEIPVEGHGND